MVELGLAGAAGQRGDLGQRYEFWGRQAFLDSKIEIYIAIKQLVLRPVWTRPGGPSGPMAAQPRTPVLHWGGVTISP